MLLTTNEATHRTITTSIDSHHLGRWSSVLLGGKDGHRTRLVSVYNPVLSNTGPMTVHRQHLRRLRSIQDYRTPREALCDNFRKAVLSWIEAGEHLVIGMDANEDVRSGPLTTMLRSCGLHNAIHSRHPSTRSISTFERNDSDTPIDAIMTTLPPHPSMRCGYLAYGEGFPGDHRTLWIDIPYTSIFGNNEPHLNRIYANPFTIQDPRVRKKYNDKVVKAYHAQGVVELAHSVRL